MANPFDDDDMKVKSFTNNSSVEDEVKQYEKEIERLMQNSLDSTQRSTRQLDSSEQLGHSMARDLLAQREKLERTEQNLDDIHHTTQLTQRSLNSLKSVFGGFFKNKFSKAPQRASTAEVKQSESTSRLSKVIEETNVPVSEMQRGPTKGGTTLSAESRGYIEGTRWEAMDNEIDNNLDVMSSQLSRLRQFGTALGDEVDDQNRMLTRIEDKASRNDSTVRRQDNQMKKLLGYKSEPITK